MQNYIQLHSRIAVAFVIAFAAIFSAAMFVYATGTLTSACAEKDGSVYVVGAGFKRTTCRSGDTALKWNPQGLFGPVSSTTIIESYATGTSYVVADAVCPTGAVLLSGGAQISSNNNIPDGSVVGSYPRSTSIWRAIGLATGGNTLTVVATALCAF